MSPIEININNIMEQPPIAYNPHSFKNEIIFNFLLQKSFLKIFNIVLYVEML